MKPWHSVSVRLTLTLLGLTLGSLVGLAGGLGSSLERFFIRDAQESLQRQARALATKASSERQDSPWFQQWANLSAHQGQVQILIFDRSATVQIQGQGFPLSNALWVPPELIQQTLAGTPQQGRFWLPSDRQHPWWLYSTAPIQTASSQVRGAVYVAMPLRRPKQFAQRVTGLAMSLTIATAAIATCAGWLLSQTFTRPLGQLHQQAERLGGGDYTARSNLAGQDELAQLGQLLNQMAAKLTETFAALEAQETARRELVANISHDLRTPLASLRVGLEAVLDGVVTGEKTQQYLKRACQETDYLARLVGQLLLLARADAGQLRLQPQAVSAIAIAQECLSRIEPTAVQANLQLEFHSVANLPKVWIDPALTGQVVLNLLDNAIKYAPDSGSICLKLLSPVRHHQHYYVPLQVQDRGPGMVPEVLQRVTERFYRQDGARQRGGLGLGLAIAQQVCQLQGGLLHIESYPEQGTIVTLWLPILSSTAA